jgi:hypothetical protein
MLSKNPWYQPGLQNFSEPVDSSFLLLGDQRLRLSCGLTTVTLPMTLSALKRPSALIPLAMSFAALGVLLVHLAIFGVAHEADEGTAAHLWQLLMAGQIPVIAFFAIRWLPRTPGPALVVLVLQAVAGLAAAAPVFYLNL